MRFKKIQHYEINNFFQDNNDIQDRKKKFLLNIKNINSLTKVLGPRPYEFPGCLL